ncbi:fatty acid desaturase family protein [Oceanobacter mangrovi]|uniref:fatty acid desaturase family protein n=1 Tax=Oceanobacter mangrovi TaxID=2862510 RepID=UPI001C8D2112|nr:fatty acid desaturase family protein [Oceanobacter mangrovi]
MENNRPNHTLGRYALLHQTVFAVALAVIAVQMIVAVEQLQVSLWWLIPAALAGWYTADASSGCAHFVLDYVKTRPNTGLRELYFYKGAKGTADYLKLRDRAMSQLSPFEKVAFDFKTHHKHPGALAQRQTLLVILPTLYPITLPFLVVISLIEWLLPGYSLLAWMLLAHTIGLTFAQHAHALSHLREPPLHGRILQKLGLFMTAKKHSSHHQNLGINFCILSGWADPLVNRIFRFCKSRGWIYLEGLEPIP